VSAGARPAFDSVLIANRGEIAVRVMRACRSLGIRTVAVYADPDAEALHVRMADNAVALGGVTAAESYLDVAKIVRAIEASGAEAVHPGYGFLSESADLVGAVTAAGCAFVGPPAEAMRIMGSKLTARDAAAAAGVPTVPGSAGAIACGGDVRRFAAVHGYPVAVKASFGGGGRGMRVVRTGAEADAGVETAQREAQAYFGRSEVYVERYLERPRHVEVQILADDHGNVVAVGTRDCSVQRRHQKLLEEAPATTLSADATAAMRAAAVALGKAVDYRGAGTLEFLAQDDEFFFLEMNTRLQVEHPVTEEVTGVDLVAEQLRIAAGLPISFAPDKVTISGHAIELRINAEDPRGGRFLPAPGTITGLDVPAAPRVRWDAGYEEGDDVPEHYDGLVGKLIVWGRDRGEAVTRARSALRELHVGGIRTTAPAHEVILKHPDFIEDRHTTRWLESADSVATALDDLPEVDPDVGVAPRRLATVGGRTYWVPAFSDNTTGTQSNPPATILQATTLLAAAGSGDGRVVSPMQGTIISVSAVEGDPVQASDIVCVLEAMKMENPIRAGRSGTITSVKAVVGQGVAPNELLLTIERLEDGNADVV
jgi:acetyl-CoA/propionyl-CoA carboxylase, biotin carboxylase, biotin carboxyl carrier protein